MQDVDSFVTVYSKYKNTTNGEAVSRACVRVCIKTSQRAQNLKLSTPKNLHHLCAYQSHEPQPAGLPSVVPFALFSPSPSLGSGEALRLCSREAEIEVDVEG